MVFLFSIQWESEQLASSVFRSRGFVCSPNGSLFRCPVPWLFGLNVVYFSAQKMLEMTIATSVWGGNIQHIQIAIWQMALMPCFAWQALLSSVGRVAGYFVLKIRTPANTNGMHRDSRVSNQCRFNKVNYLFVLQKSCLS